MLLDTGAALPLLGSETLRHIGGMILDELGETITVQTSSNKFTGIGGKSQPSLGIVEIPLGLSLPDVSRISIHTDVIGGHGSACPGLLPLKVLLEWKASILCNTLPQGDGILVLELSGTKAGRPIEARTFFVQIL